MSESVPRAQRKQRSPAEFRPIQYSFIDSAQSVFLMAQQTRDIALDTRDSMYRIEDLLESYLGLAKMREGIRETGIGVVLDAAEGLNDNQGPR